MSAQMRKIILDTAVAGSLQLQPPEARIEQKFRCSQNGTEYLAETDSIYRVWIITSNEGERWVTDAVEIMWEVRVNSEFTIILYYVTAPLCRGRRAQFLPFSGTLMARGCCKPRISFAEDVARNLENRLLHSKRNMITAETSYAKTVKCTCLFKLFRPFDRYLVNYCLQFVQLILNQIWRVYPYKQNILKNNP